MGHELDFSTGDAAFVQLGDRVDAWHRLGTFITPAELAELTPPERMALVMERGRLNYRVEPFDIFDGDHNLIPGYKSFERDDTHERFGIFPETYTIFQNSDARDLMMPMIDAGMIAFETAGAIYGGRDMWMLFTFNPQNEAVADYFKEQGIIPYLALHNNHDRSRLLSLFETYTKIVCKNTLAAATGAFGAHKRRAGRYPSAVLLRHTKNVKSMSVDAVNDLWGRMTTRMEDVMHSYERLRNRFISEEEFESSVLEKLAPMPRDPEDPRAEKALLRSMERRVLLRKLYQGAGAGIDGQPTAWNAYMAATEAVDHFRDLFTAKDESAALFIGGSLANKKQDVLNALDALAIQA